MRAVIRAIVICAGTLTGACGVKGPLYLPNVPKDASWPYKTDKPAPASSHAPDSSTAPSSKAQAASAASPSPSDSSSPSTSATPAPETK